MKKRIIFSFLAVYIGWIAWNAGHVYASDTAHGCRQKGNSAHRCRHVSANGKDHKDARHDGAGHLDNDRVSRSLRQARAAAMFFQDYGDDASTPPECTCPVSCFFSGDGIPSPYYPNE